MKQSVLCGERLLHVGEVVRRECVNLVDCLDYDRLRLSEPLRSLPQEYTDTGVGDDVHVLIQIFESADVYEHLLTFLLL